MYNHAPLVLSSHSLLHVGACLIIYYVNLWRLRFNYIKYTIGFVGPESLVHVSVEIHPVKNVIVTIIELFKNE